MHNCGVASEKLYEKDVAKVMQRWRVHPEYAELMNSIYQDALHRIEKFNIEQAGKLTQEGAGQATGRSRYESAQLLAGFMLHIKHAARTWLDQHGKA